MIDFIGRRRWYALLSGAMLVPALIALAVWQFEPGLDFSGGLETEVRFLAATDAEAVEQAVAGVELPDGSTLDVVATDDATFRIDVDLGEQPELSSAALIDDLTTALASAQGVVQEEDRRVLEERLSLEIWFPADVMQDDVRDALQTIDHGDARIQATTEAAFKIRVQEPENGDLEFLRVQINDALESELGSIFVLQSEGVSGILSSEIAQDAAIALVVAAVAILIYISLAFRRLPNPILYGSAAIVALLHDITIVTGAFAIGGQVAGLEVNAMFITALLAIIGYSVNDTIVVFDRIREHLLADPGEEVRTVVNAAITQSLGRSLNTSITVVLALVALLLIGGVTIQPFVIVLLIGAIAGTYSSIAVASQIVVLWQEGSIQRRFGAEPQETRRRRVAT